MIPVMCNCANNKIGVCYGNCNTAHIEDVMSNRIAVKDCPGYIPVDQPAFEGVPQGDVIIGPEGSKKL